MKLYSDQELAEILDQDVFHLIGDCADELGVECYVVGGYVRDIFLERPSKDIDVVVVGYTSPNQLKAREVVVEGINFIPDKHLMDVLRSAQFSFVRRKHEPVSEIPRGELLKTLADHCAAHGSITRHEFQRLFHVTRYRADQILTGLVSEEFPKYYRIKAGT